MGPQTLPPRVLPRVTSLVRLLASPIDAEVLAAARAIDRTLAGAGCDIHTLADRIGQAPAAIPNLQPARRPRAPWRGSRLKETWPETRQAEIGARLRTGMRSGLFTPWEVKFATSIVRGIEREQTSFSESQAEIVEELVQRAARWSARR